MYIVTSTFLIMSFEAFLKFLEQGTYKVLTTATENNSTILIL